MKAIEAQGLAFARPERGEILGDISFKIGEGSRLAILGANGAGKTTLLSLLGGRLVAARGSILLDGVAIREFSPRALARKIAFLPQIERLPFNYRVLEFVLMGRAPHIEALSQPGAGDEEIARRALAELGLEYLADRRAGEISGGEYQLVRIARCLAQEAEILLLDEPTSLLDPANASRVARELASLASKGKTIVFSTHDIGLARSLSDLVLVLGNRRLLRAGFPSEVLTPVFLEEAFGVEFGIGQIPTAYPAASPR
ncbi:MAG: ABC transporter ATP-binding protein [Rectinemataceae bacterium]